MKISKLLFTYITLSLLILTFTSLNTFADKDIPITEVPLPHPDALPSPDEFVLVETQPEFTYKESPKYPGLAIKHGVEGEVWVKVLVGKDGTVKDAMIFKESGKKVGFEGAALKAAKKCKYRPAMRNNEPVAVWITYSISFKLKSGNKSSSIDSPNDPPKENEQEEISVEMQPQFIHQEAPKYPEKARKEGIEGEVMVQVLIDKNGDVAKAFIFKESGKEVGFEESALKAAWQCKFKPATQDNKPIAVWITYPVKFQIR